MQVAGTLPTGLNGTTYNGTASSDFVMLTHADKDFIRIKNDTQCMFEGEFTVICNISSRSKSGLKSEE